MGLRLLVMVVALLAACSRGEEQPEARPRPASVPVTVAAVEQKPMPVELSAVGHVQPIQSVAVRAQIGGQIDRAHFQEGDEVERGAILFTLDRRELQAQLRQAEAALARNQALAENAAAEARRYRELVDQGFVARSQYEQLVANAKAAAAAAQADRAAVQHARLQLEHAVIRAPISGRTGRALVDPGSVIRANETELVLINRIAPIAVAFAVPAQHLSEIQARQGKAPVPVAARSSDGATVTGRLTFINNRVNPETGAIDLEARFPNDQRRLWPGQFVTTTLTLGVDTDALVVPGAAVQTGQEGTYVFVVKPDQTVEMRPVTVARSSGEVTVLAAGVAPGEPVVTEGHLRLAPGVAVDVTRPTDTPAASPRS